ncbi:hypothetical protein C8R43DRAFT_1041594 [Mycena crocata]|nr:hypothetical protein C8R43DRAFT_1041594 [Mycena crocata]
MCTHQLPQINCAIDPVDTILLTSKPSKSQSFVCIPYRYVPQVPQEIIDIIVDSVEDMATFKACSLVCWAFVPASRMHIFRAISLDMLNDAPYKIYEMLLRSPHIALYVRDLTIYRSHDTTLWMQPGSPLPAVLSMLSHIKRFSLFACWGNWEDAPATLQAAMHRVVSSGTLDRLHILTANNMPAAFVNSALSIRILSMFHCSMDTREDPRLIHLPETQESAAPEYLNLSLDSKTGKILEHMHAPGSTRFSNIRRLALNPLPNSINSASYLAGVLGAVESTLERLDLQVHEKHFTPIDTSRLAALREIQIHVVMADPGVLPGFLPRTITRLRTSNPLLESFTFVLHLPQVAGVDLPAPNAFARAMRTIDAALGANVCDPGVGFPALREVHWKIIPEADPPTLVPDYPAVFSAHLPRTRARGILSIEQGYRTRGAAVMPLLPYTSVWPHRSKK